jgi:hypothetical protein
MKKLIRIDFAALVFIIITIGIIGFGIANAAGIIHAAN